MLAVLLSMAFFLSAGQPLAEAPGYEKGGKAGRDRVDAIQRGAGDSQPQPSG